MPALFALIRHAGSRVSAVLLLKVPMPQYPTPSVPPVPASAPRRRWLRPATAAGGCLTLAAACLLSIQPASAVPAGDKRRSSQQPQGLHTNEPAAYALTNADVVVRPGEMVEDATIVIRDGMIESVGEEDAPADMVAIDMDGKRIYAGFIDAYATLPDEASATSPALSVPQSARYWNDNVVPQIDAGDILQINGQAHGQLRQAGFVARAYAPASGNIKGTMALVTTRDGAEGDSAVLSGDFGMVASVTRERGRGAGGRGGYPSSPMGAMTLVRQALYDAQWYGQANAAVEEDASLARPERNDALAALKPVLDGDVPMWFVSPDELYVLRGDQVAKEFGLNAVIVGSGDEFRRADLIAGVDRPMVLPLDFPSPPDVSTPEMADATTLERLMEWDLSPSNPAMMHERDVTFALTTDGLRRIEREFHPNLKKAIARGLPADAALAALTTNAAELTGSTNLLGTVEAGKLASFVVADGDLFEEDGKAKILETWVDGKRHILERDPVIDIRGKYEIEGVDGLTFEIAGEANRLRGTFDVPGSTTKPSDQAKPDAENAAADDEEATEAVEEARDDADDNQGEADNDQGEARGPAQGGPRGARGGPAARGGPPAANQLKNVKQSADSVSFTLPGDKFGQPGVVQVSLTRIGDQFVGTMVMPDGTRKSITAKRTGDASTQPATRPDGTTIDAEVPTVEGEDGAGEGVPTEQATDDEGNYEGGTAREGETAEGDDAEMEDEVETTPTTGPAAVAKADAKKAPLYQPNYPLGAFGRETPAMPEAQTVVVRNVTIWTSGPAGNIENGTLIVKDGKIHAVGADDEVDVDGEFKVIEGEGLHVTAGIIDCHSHIATDGGVNEGGQAITCDVRIGDFVDPNDINMYRQLAGGTTMANVLHGSANPIGGQNQVIKFRWGVGPEELKFAEAPQGVKFALGENPIRVGDDGRYPNSRMGVNELIEDSFATAKDYRDAMTAFENDGGMPVRRNLEMDALVEMLEGTRLIHAHSYRQDEILALLRTLEKNDIQIATLQHILEGYKVAKEMAEHGAGASTFSDWWAYKFEVYDAIPYNAAIMHNAGVLVSLNSDDAELARRLNLEAAKAVKYGGVPEEEALNMVTINPAKQLRVDEFVGSLEEGKHADFVVWNGSPLSTKSRVLQTWVDGRKVFDSEENVKLNEQVLEMRSKLIQRVLSSGERAAEPGEGRPRPSTLWPKYDEYCHVHDHGDFDHSDHSDHSDHDHD